MPSYNVNDKSTYKTTFADRKAYLGLFNLKTWFPDDNTEQTVTLLKQSTLPTKAEVLSNGFKEGLKKVADFKNSVFGYGLKVFWIGLIVLIAYLIFKHTKR